MWRRHLYHSFALYCILSVYTPCRKGTGTLVTGGHLYFISRSKWSKICTNLHSGPNSDVVEKYFKICNVLLYFRAFNVWIFHMLYLFLMDCLSCALVTKTPKFRAFFSLPINNTVVWIFIQRKWEGFMLQEYSTKVKTAFYRLVALFYTGLECTLHSALHGVFVILSTLLMFRRPFLACTLYILYCGKQITSPEKYIINRSIRKDFC